MRNSDSKGWRCDLSGNPVIAVLAGKPQHRKRAPVAGKSNLNRLELSQEAATSAITRSGMMGAVPQAVLERAQTVAPAVMRHVRRRMRRRNPRLRECRA